MKRGPGTYALILLSNSEAPIQVGRLGQLQLQRGFYVYVGSALGPGGVWGRIAHHRKARGQPHWHIDYLKGHAQLDQVWYSYTRLCREHQWAALIKGIQGARMPLLRFGSSDCNCDSHLYFFERLPSRGSFQREVRALDRKHPPVQSTAF